MSSGEAAHPALAVNINGYLVFTEEGNTQLSLSCVVVLESFWNFWFHDLSPGQSSCELLSLPQEDLPTQGSSA